MIDASTWAGVKNIFNPRNVLSKPVFVCSVRVCVVIVIGFDVQIEVEASRLGTCDLFIFIFLTFPNLYYF